MPQDRLFDPQNTMKPLPEPRFEIDSFSDLIFDEHAKGWPATISYEYFLYEGVIHLCKLTVSTSLRHVDQEDIVNMLHFREGKRIELETKMILV